MANPTTNYGFVLPTSTDLVTDLPADFDVALQGVDTRLKALQPGTTLGDLMYASATANTNTRLGIGTNGQVLAVSGGVPAWTTTSDVTPLTTKGDLFTFTTVDARLGVGTDGQVLQADSTASTGLKWATTSAGSLTKISTTSMSAVATQDFLSVFTGTYRAYIVEFSSLKTSAGGTATLQASFYSGTNTPYTDGIRGGFVGINQSGAAATGFGMASGAVASMCLVPPDGERLAGGNWNVSNAQGGSGLNITGQFIGGGNGTEVAYAGGFKSTNATAITGFKLYCSSGNITGTVTIYGLEN